MKRYPIIVFTLVFAFSIFLSRFIVLPDNILILIISLFVLTASFFIEKQAFINKSIKNVVMLISAFTLSFLINNYRLNKQDNHYSESSFSGELFVRSLIYENENFQSFIAEDLNSNERFFVEFSGDYKFKQAECFIPESDPRAIETGVKLPYKFNYNEYLIKKGIYRKIRLKSFSSTDSKAPLDVRIQAFVNEKIRNSDLSTQSKGLIIALTLGDKSNLDKELKENFSRAGLMHLLALSGLHIGILSFSLLFILRLIFRNKHSNTPSIIVVFMLFFYSYISGFSPSILRASIMFGVIIISQLAKRKSNIYNSLSIAALILLLIGPDNFFEIGFQLSFAAVLSIVSVFPLLKKIYYPKNKISRYFYDIILVSLAAQLGTAVISIYYFHSFPILFLASNLLEIPLFTIILFLSYVEVILISSNINFILLNNIYDFLSALIFKISEIIASFDYLYIENILIKDYAFIIWILIIVSLIYALKSAQIKNLYPTLILVVLLQIISIVDHKNAQYKSYLFIAKNDVFIKNKSSYANHKKAKTVFIENILMEKLDSTELIQNNFIFNNNYYVIIDSLNIKNYQTKYKHKLIINDNINLNPAELINPNTSEIIFNHKDYFMKYRWENYARNMKLSFFSATDSLYIEEANNHININ